MLRCGPILLALVSVLAAPAVADEVYLKDAGKITGRIVKQTDTHVEVEVGIGSITVPLSAVSRIEKGPTALDDFDARAAHLGASDKAGWLALAEWAAREGLSTYSRRAYEHVLAIDPSDATANRARGRVEVDGRWMSEDDAYRARGYVLFEGQWITPDERDVILRERDMQDTLERERAESEARVREAEARAAEAEARAREAEAAAGQAMPGIPLWWGANDPGTVIVPGWPVFGPAVTLPGRPPGGRPCGPAPRQPCAGPLRGATPGVLPPATTTAPPRTAAAPRHRAVPREGTSSKVPARQPPPQVHRSPSGQPRGEHTRSAPV